MKTSPAKRRKTRSKRLAKKMAKAQPSVAETVGHDIFRSALADLASESWRLARVLEGVLAAAPRPDRTNGQLRYFRGRLTDILSAVHMGVVSAEGEDFDIGMPFRGLNLDEFEPDEALVVERVIEPAIIGPGGVMKSGTLLLKRKPS